MTQAYLPKRYNFSSTVNMMSTYGIISHGRGDSGYLASTYLFDYGDVQFYGFSCSNILGN